MGKRFLFAMVAILSLGAFLMAWKAFSQSPELLPKVENVAQTMQRQPLTADSQSRLPGDDLPPPQSMLGIQGVAAFVVDDVLAGSPADKGGLKAGDLITWVNGNQVNSVTDVLQISRKSRGHKVELFVLRYNPNTQQRDPVTLNLTTAPLKAVE